MAVTFSYPDAATPVIVFSRALFSGDLATPHAHQDKEESDSGEVAAYSYGDGYVEHPLTVQVPKAAQTGTTASVALLKSFIQDTIDWSANPFYYIDPDSASHLVRLMNSDLSDAVDYVNYVQYKLILREEL